LRYAANKPELSGSMSGAACNIKVANIIHKCLCPKPEDRPSAKDILEALNGIGDYASEEAGVTEASSITVKESTTSDSSAPSKNGQQISLVSESDISIDMNIATKVGRHLCKVFGDDAQFMSDHQFELKKRDRNWHITPNCSAINETILNGKAIREETTLATNDIIGVGKEEKGIIKLPLTVKFG